VSSVDVALFVLVIQLLVLLIDYRNTIKKSVNHICRANCYRFGGLRGCVCVCALFLVKWPFHEKQRTDWWIILRWIFRKCDGDMEWIDLAQDRDR